MPDHKTAQPSTHPRNTMLRYMFRLLTDARVAALGRLLEGRYVYTERLGNVCVLRVLRAGSDVYLHIHLHPAEVVMDTPRLVSLESLGDIFLISEKEAAS